MKDWYEDLPEYCPPKEAFAPKGMTVYRFSSSDFPSNNDFISQRLLSPDRVFEGVCECITGSLSVYNQLDACYNIYKLPRHRKRFKTIMEVSLNDSDGLIMQTFQNPYHYSWWRSNSFNFDAVKIVQ
jgi:hypothetical protein